MLSAPRSARPFRWEMPHGLKSGRAFGEKPKTLRGAKEDFSKTPPLHKNADGRRSGRHRRGPTSGGVERGVWLSDFEAVRAVRRAGRWLAAAGSSASTCGVW